MTSAAFKQLLSERLGRMNLAVPEGASDRFELYLRLLRRWNAKINLTALPLDPPVAGTIDRLLVEAVAASRLMEDLPGTWFDLGTGGGSPAVPLKILNPRRHLVMVESRAKKASFLREAVRELELAGADVENARIEDAVNQVSLDVDVVTARAITGRGLFDSVDRLLGPQGKFLWFRGDSDSNYMDNSGLRVFKLRETVELCGPHSWLSVLQRDCST